MPGDQVQRRLERVAREHDDLTRLRVAKPDGGPITTARW